MNRRGLTFALLCAFGCRGPAPRATTPPPSAPPPPQASAHSPVAPFLADSAAPSSAPAVPPRFAQAAGYMPLASSGVDQFRVRHPTYDGRGVLIGILDSGLDPSVPGLQVTTTGAPKVLDVRDFSGEGRVLLVPVAPLPNGTIVIAGRTLGGVGRIARLTSSTTWYGGVLRESALGRLPGADLNGDGTNTGVFPVVVVKASDGWVAFLDADLDGSFEDDKPLHDYRAGRETALFGTRPFALAANLTESGGVPLLDFVFDDASHGTHVAGVAAGHALFDVPDFDGVAPGAQLLGLKITDNSRGGVSVTGSIARALSYAARFADERGLRLVLNLSFAIATRHDGRATIDSIVDAFLATHPGVVFAIAAGNEGPGLSTLGSPASADLALSVGAGLPLVFAQSPNDSSVLPRGAGDIAGWWSARGGELAKPDIVAPGFAFSAVPRFATGEELKRGTSVAAPYAAGLAACLLSAMTQERRPVSAVEIIAALRASARQFAGTTTLDRGAGQPRLDAAYRWLVAGHQGSAYGVRTASGASAAFRRDATLVPGDTLDLFRVRHRAGLRAARFQLRSSVPWLTGPPSVTAGAVETPIVTQSVLPNTLPPGVYTGALTAKNPSDTLAGPLFSLVSTLVVPYDLSAHAMTDAGRVVGAARVQRYFFRVPGKGASLHASVMLPESLAGRAAVRLYEPTGSLDRTSLESRNGGTVSYLVRAEDVVAGVYELDVAAPPLESVATTVRAQLAPFALNESDGKLELYNPGSVTGAAAILQAALGVERDYDVSGRGASAETLTVRMPAWAAGANASIDVELPPEQWSRLTGFGVTEFDSAGHQLAENPLSWTFNRQRLTLPAPLAGRPLLIELFPAFARPDGGEPWHARVCVRVFLPAEQPLGSETPVSIVPGGRLAIPVLAPPSPGLAAPEGFGALVEVRVRSAVTGSVDAVRRIVVPLHP